MNFIRRTWGAEDCLLLYDGGLDRAGPAVRAC